MLPSGDILTALEILLRQIKEDEDDEDVEVVEEEKATSGGQGRVGE